MKLVSTSNIFVFSSLELIPIPLNSDEFCCGASGSKFGLGPPLPPCARWCPGAGHRRGPGNAQGCPGERTGVLISPWLNPKCSTSFPGWEAALKLRLKVTDPLNWDMRVGGMNSFHPAHWEHFHGQGSEWGMGTDENMLESGGEELHLWGKYQWKTRKSVRGYFTSGMLSSVIPCWFLVTVQSGNASKIQLYKEVLSCNQVMPRIVRTMYQKAFMDESYIDILLTEGP